MIFYLFFILFVFICLALSRNLSLGGKFKKGTHFLHSVHCSSNVSQKARLYSIKEKKEPSPGGRGQNIAKYRN